MLDGSHGSRIFTFHTRYCTCLARGTVLERFILLNILLFRFTCRVCSWHPVVPFISRTVFGNRLLFPFVCIDLDLLRCCCCLVSVSSFQARRALESKGIGGALSSLWARMKRYVNVEKYCCLLPATRP